MPKTFVSEDEIGKGSYLWILKPTFMNRGRGIALFNSLEEFEKLIWKFYQGEDLEDYSDKNFNIEEIEVEKT
jgi:glutathione synthase/RimK-type ligase-like ATP-grasp enzyme